jgi:hypothetical protein
MVKSGSPGEKADARDRGRPARFQKNQESNLKEADRAIPPICAIASFPAYQSL